MRRAQRGVVPRLEVMETRVQLDAASPLLTRHAMAQVVREVKAIVGTLARTGNEVRASERLTRLSERIPSGPEGLAPHWRADVALFRPHAAGAMVATRDRILGDLYRFVGGGGEGGNPPAGGSGALPTVPGGGPGTGGVIAPLPAPSLDSVTIRNATGLALSVTVHLEVPQVQKPWITEIIPAQGTTTLPFDFRSATNAFMTIDVRRADGGQSPPPFIGFDLPQPMGGYDGTPFTVSVLGSYFNITPG